MAAQLVPVATGLFATLAWLGLQAGCVPALPEPDTSAHAGAVPVEVPFYPPAARVDVVPNAPASQVSPAWIDGQWEWQGRRWIWTAGRWVDRDKGLEYAAPIVLRRSDGQLVWFRGELRQKKARVDSP